MSRKLPFHTLDVFTERRFGGNPLAVVHEADGLSDAAMQAIASEFSLPETVFVLKPSGASHTARVRIFTPTKELPFAGHPTVGTAVLMAELRAPQQHHDALVVMEQAVGTVRVGVRLRPGQAPFAEFDAPKLPMPAGALPSLDQLAAGLGLIPSELAFENHKPTCYAAGNAFALIPVMSLDAMAKARVNGAYWTAAFEEQGLVGAYLYTRQCLHTTSAFHARMFAPSSGIPEDPATGSAAVSLAGAIQHFDDLPDGTHKRAIEQGHEMGRPSLIQLTLVVEGGKLATVRIGGHAVRVTAGVLEV